MWLSSVKLGLVGTGLVNEDLDGLGLVRLSFDRLDLKIPGDKVDCGCLRPQLHPGIF